MSNQLNLNKVNRADIAIICQGAHKKVIQSILDFDFLAGKDSPSIKAIVSQGRRNERFFFGNTEILLPLFENIQEIPELIKKEATYFLNVSSGRRVLSSTKEALATFPNLIGAAVFAENVPERHSIELIQLSKEYGVWITGPASVGFLLPGKLKLGAIGGIDHTQIITAKLLTGGKAAVLSSSGGMTNEMINIVARAGMGVSFSLSFGGDKFPIMAPDTAFLAAEKDKSTDVIVYFGELGGDDEYRLVELLKQGKVNKPVVAYIAGSVADLFEVPPQFGHAKAMATTEDESAIAKRKALRKAGAYAPETFAEFLKRISKLSKKSAINENNLDRVIQDSRRQALFVSSLDSVNQVGDLQIAGHTLAEYAQESFGYVVSSLLLGRAPRSKKLPEIVELVMKLLVDHGPHVSGAVNTMVTARAGKDLPSALSAGILTIGPRFGGAINEAARTWLRGVESNTTAPKLVEEFATQGIRIQGIGHKKYRVDNPDPRVDILLESVGKTGEYTEFARSVEAVTTEKSGNLILNVDGAIAAVLLDVLKKHENMTSQELKELADIEFFNALFVLARSVGFTAHYLDQRRIDEGLFRLTGEHIS